MAEDQKRSGADAPSEGSVGPDGTRPDETYRYQQHRGQGGSPVQGSDYGRIRKLDEAGEGRADDPQLGGEDHDLGGWGSDWPRAREGFGGGGPASGGAGDEYAPGTPPGHGSGTGALGQGGAILHGGRSSPDEEGAPAPDEHPGILQPDGERRRPD
jgi:hypothetical protein